MPRDYVHARIERAIGERILGGEFAPGMLLPNEAAWGKTFGASRTAVREAIKSLTAKGLIQSKPKIGSRVLARSQWNMLDRDVLTWHRSAMDHRAFLMSTQEARHLLEPGIAELAAQKRTPRQLEELRASLKDMRAADTVAKQVAADVAFHDALLSCANNDLLRPFGIIIERALSNLFDYTTARNPHFANALKLHGEVVRAVAASDPALARRRMMQLLHDTDAVIAAAPRRRAKKSRNDGAGRNR